MQEFQGKLLKRLLKIKGLLKEKFC